MIDPEFINKAQVALPALSKEDFLTVIVDALGTYAWPAGAIESINPSATRLVYLPGYRMRGTAEATWTAKADGTTKLTVNDHEMNIADGRQYSGTIPPVDFDLLVINDNAGTPYWAKDFCTVDFEEAQFAPYSAIAETGGQVEGDSSGNPLMGWAKNGNALVDNAMTGVAEELSENAGIAYMALGILPAEIVAHSMEMFADQKFNSRDVKVQSRNSITEDPTPVFIPFYVLEFQFEGKQYHLAMMADAGGMFKGKVPPAADKGKTPEQIVQEEMPDKVNQLKFLKWGWVLAIVLWLAINFIVALVFLVAWAIGYWFMKKPVDARLKELQSQNRAGQRRNAEMLRRQLLG